MNLEEIGIRGYYNGVRRAKGRIKVEPEDFIVEEESHLGIARVRYFLGMEIPEFQGGEGEHLAGVLEKRDLETTEAVRRLARTLGVSRKRIGYAGNKDKKALTAQFVTIWRGEPEVVERKKWVFYPLKFVRKKIKIGYLRGNHFRIRVRDLEGEIPRISVFPNFFGPQRFGSYRFISHIMGKHVFWGEWEEAVEEYLGREGDEPEETIRARRLWRETHDPKVCLKEFPNNLVYERIILQALAEGKSPEEAVKSLPRRLLTLFLHAYQSLLFNRVLSERLSVSKSPLEGDIMKNGVPTGPIYGYRVPLASGTQGEIEERVLEEEGEGFMERAREWGLKGSRRPLWLPVDLKISGDTVSFFLPKGSYATMVLREILDY